MVAFPQQQPCTARQRKGFPHRAGICSAMCLERLLHQGELSFERLLRVDGSFKGILSSTGDLVIGENGIIRGNIIGLREVRVCWGLFCW